MNDGNPDIPVVEQPPVPADEARRLAREQDRRACDELLKLKVARFSNVRMDAFLESGPEAENSSDQVLGRYAYSVAYAEVLYPALHYLEVSLRNAVYDAIATRFPAAAGVDISDCWLDLPMTATPLTQAPREPWKDDTKKVEQAKRDIRNDGRALSSGRLIAELNFGFWTGLFRDCYGGRPNDTDPKKFWPALLPVAFPRLPAAGRTRAYVADRLHKIRHLRNRAYHHEPLWKRSLRKDADLILGVVDWIDPTIATLAAAATRSREVQERGIAGHAKRMREFARAAFAEQGS